MCPVAIVVVCGDLTGDGYAVVDAIHAVRVIDVLGQIGMCVVEPGVDVSDEHGRTATGNGMGFRGVDLPHVPLQR